MSTQPPSASTASAIGPCPTIIQNVGRPGTGSLPSTITPPDHPRPGLEKLTNANRSVSSVNDRLFPVELTEIADWKSMSEYMLRSNFGKP